MSSLARHLKLTLLKTVRRTGVSRLVLDSSWRQQRLLILCYHGTSLEDEHLWCGGLYITAETLRSRLEFLRASRCNVLAFAEAVRRLYAGELPPRSVALTYDDGTYDFYSHAFPVIQKFRFPVTVYWTTYYAEYNRPVFDVMCSYLLWKRRGKRVDLSEFGAGEVMLDEAGLPHAERSIKDLARRESMGGRDKDALLASLAQTLGLDYEALCERRLLSIMNPEEASRLASAGVDLQLHTHRHRMSAKPERLRREIEDNRSRIEAITKRQAKHFCYPGGLILPAFPALLGENGVATATTCRPGICTRDTNPMLMPRLLDTSETTMEDFVAWVSGFAAWLPQREYAPMEGQLLEEGETQAEAGPGL